MAETDNTAAHYQTMVLNERLRLWFPEHEPRTTDPHYKLFARVKRALIKNNVPCWRCGVVYANLVKRGDSPTALNPLGACQLEAHHSDIEFSLMNAVDVELWWSKSYESIEDFTAKHPEFAAAAASDDDDEHRDLFLAYVESEGNLQQLCDVCHRSKDQGVHHIPYPEWRVMAYWDKSLPAHITSTPA